MGGRDDDQSCPRPELAANAVTALRLALPAGDPPMIPCDRCQVRHLGGRAIHRQLETKPFNLKLPQNWPAKLRQT